MAARNTVRCLAGVMTSGVLALASAGAAAAAPGDVQPFTMAGSPAPGIYPGASAAIDLQFTNPNDLALTLQDLTVSIQSITQAPGAVGACTAADFEIAQLPAAVDVVLPPSSSATLSALGVAAADLPRFGMLNTSLNQDGCQGATITLLYTGTATAPEVGGVDQPPVEVPGEGTGTGGGVVEVPGEVAGENLPRTGANRTDDVIALGAGLVIAGSAAVVAVRRRRSTL